MMVAKLRSWLQQHRVAVGVVGIVLIVVIVLIILGYWFDWTGFNGYNKVTTARTMSGPNAGTVIRTEEYQQGKALWDWLQLLIIPAVLAVGGYLFNYSTSRTEREVATDRQRQEALQTFIDKTSELLLLKNLRDVNYQGEAPKIIRARLLAILPELDGKRKASVLQFLYEAGLIYRGRGIVDLRKADLSGADLRGAHLHKVNLCGANLR
jgi:hypothetical protein